MKIKAIPAQLTWGIRQKAMWPLNPISYVQLTEDEKGQHYGAYIENELVSVISVFTQGSKAQFRKFATLPNQQGNGYGSYLLSHVFDAMSKANIKKLWCNARLDKTSFYKKFGMVPTSITFERGNISYVIMEYHLPEQAQTPKLPKY